MLLGDTIATNASVKECDSWSFDTTEFPATAVTEVKHY